MIRSWTPLLVLGIGAGLFGFQTPGAPQEHVLVLMGDTDGYLSPCGCTKPMTGGIRRRASAVRTLTKGVEATVLENGGLVSGSGRQDHLKAEALGEALRHMGVTAANLTQSEARLGQGLVESLRNLAGGLFVQSNLRSGPSAPVAPYLSHGPFLIGGASSAHGAIASVLGEASVPNDAAAKSLAEAAESAGLLPILMLADGLEEARRLAKLEPRLRLIQYRSTGKPLDAPLWEGKTMLVSPGEKGKFVLRLGFLEGAFTYATVELTPNFEDDPAVSRVYRAYLARVDRENLLSKVPRTESKPFAGTSACLPCHQQAAQAFADSEHAHALQTLRDEGHGRDPDCVGCHVVGLERTTGFRSLEETPDLANVGCESCHGPGADHAAKPEAFPMPKVGAASCAPCHVPAHSPGFDFPSYWEKIKH
jgi:hypothetical protein